MTFTDILNLFRQGKTTARSHMKNLIEIAAVDGNFNLDEQNLLQTIATRNNISQKQLLSIKENPEKISFEIPKNETTKFLYMYELVHMMSVDKNIHPEELRLCELFAVKFGYPKNIIKEMIDTIKLNIENGNDATETYKRISSYLKLV